MSGQVDVITRVDMFTRPQGVCVYKYPDGWKAGSTNMGDYDFHVNTDTSLADMIAWFKERGWVVREWPGGARAFRKGAVFPVRTRGMILEMRRRLTQDLYNYAGKHPLGEIGHYDLTLDL
jgi:hypothetical protein